MKRQTYLTPSRRLPKAPLPFNLPSLRREAGGDGAGGGIAGAGAKWASPRAEAVEEARVEEKREDAPAKAAWGGAGLRTARTQPDFPALTPRASGKEKEPAHQKPNPRPVSTTDDEDWAEDDDGMDFSEAIALPEVTLPDLPPPAPAPARPQPPVPSPPRVLQNPARRHNLPPPAPHWAQAIKLQEMDQRSAQEHSRQPFPQREYQPRPFDLRAVEDQPNIMKTKAEIAHEARVKAEKERERTQRERSAKKLRELEERLGLTKPQHQPEQPAVSTPVPHPQSTNGAIPQPTTQSRPDTPSEAESPGTPRVLLRRPKAEAIPQMPATPTASRPSFEDAPGSSPPFHRPDGRTPSLNRVAAHDRVPPVNRAERNVSGEKRSDSAIQPSPVRPSQSATAQLGPQTDGSHVGGQPGPIRRGRQARYGSYDQRHVSGAYDGRGRRPSSRYQDDDEPGENETREQWLERRRKKTETRDAVRSVIELMINRAVYGYRPGHKRQHPRRSHLHHGQGYVGKREHPRRDSQQAPGAVGMQKASRPRHGSRTPSTQQRRGVPPSWLQPEQQDKPVTKESVSPVPVQAQAKPVQEAVEQKPSTATLVSAQIAAVEAAPRQAPQRRFAPAPLRPAPWAPKPNGATKPVHVPSPIASELRAEAEAKAAISQGGQSIANAPTPAEARALRVKPSRPSAHTSTTLETPDLDVISSTSASDSSSNHFVTQRKTDTSLERSARVRDSSESPLRSVREQAKSVTIPPPLGGNVRVLMKPSQTRDTTRRATVFSQAANGTAVVDRAGTGTTSREKGAYQRGRGHRMEHVRKERSKYAKRSTETIAAPEATRNDINGKSQPSSFAMLGTSASLSRDEGEESKAWAARNGAPPPTSFDEITRAFSNQPAAFPLVGAPMIPPVPVVPVLNPPTHASSSQAVEAKSNMWSDNKPWGGSTTAPGAPSGWWSIQNQEADRKHERTDQDLSTSTVADEKSLVGPGVKRERDRSNSSGASASSEQSRPVPNGPHMPRGNLPPRSKGKKFVKGPRKPRGRGRPQDNFEKHGPIQVTKQRKKDELDLSESVDLIPADLPSAVSAATTSESDHDGKGASTVPSRKQKAYGNSRTQADGEIDQSNTEAIAIPQTGNGTVSSARSTEATNYLEPKLDNGDELKQSSEHPPSSRSQVRDTVTSVDASRGTRGRGKRVFGKPRRRDHNHAHREHWKKDWSETPTTTTKSVRELVRLVDPPAAGVDKAGSRNLNESPSETGVNESTAQPSMDENEISASQSKQEAQQKKSYPGKVPRRGERHKPWQKTTRPQPSTSPKAATIDETHSSAQQAPSTEKRALNLSPSTLANGPATDRMDEREASAGEKESENGDVSLTGREHSESWRGRGHRRFRGRGRGRGWRGGRGRGRGRWRGRGGRTADSSDLGESNGTVTQPVVSTDVTSVQE